jgi:hypothetical protein
MRISRQSQQTDFALLQFDLLPGSEEKARLAAQGIELLEYLPDNTYTISFKGSPDAVLLQQAGARSLFRLEPRQKMEEHLAKGQIPSWAVTVPGTIDAWISFPRSFTSDEVIRLLQEKNIDILPAPFVSYRIIAVRLAVERLSELAAFSFVEYLQPKPPADHTLNNNSRNSSRANILNAPIANGGKGLNGEGVVVGIGDNADVQHHADFSNRLINRAAAGAATHGTHTTGTLAGAGNINELYRGYAPKATIVSQNFFRHTFQRGRLRN